MAILIDAKQLSKHKYVVGCDGAVDMGIPASAVNVLAYKCGWNDALDSVERLAPTVNIDAITESHEEIGYDKGFRDGYAEALEVTGDVVPVVRCKNCKYYNLQHHYCEGIGNWFGIEGEWSDNGYCYKGERREDGTL